MTEAPTYDELSALLQHVGYSESASHFHGLLCGALCRVEPEQLSEDSLLEDARDGSEPLDPNSRSQLRLARNEACADLMSTDMSFEPLLPADTTSLAQRVEALAAWCGGFLYGLSSHAKLDIRKLSEEARETLRDFTQFTQAGSEGGSDTEAEEAAYVELVEYVRVGAQLLFLELRPKPASVDDPSSTLH